MAPMKVLIKIALILESKQKNPIKIANEEAKRSCVMKQLK